ncbi:hypothetical protein B4U79_12330 [Dinothrombium tinctorium]|uniref:Uncharacterized protein n=1 Tax=Dinothrombium tinctorium TaxID=1965070 RepID=A0A443R4F5_9ACAR|nr:hypothetical protein B4U79_12330 [Dinothrombium tinctorium]
MYRFFIVPFEIYSFLVFSIVGWRKELSRICLMI